MATTVVNVRVDEFDVYIGRAMPGFAASRFANPFRIGPDGSRAQVIARYRQHLDALLASDPQATVELESLRGKRLGCWCKPAACHGDVLFEKLEGSSSLQPAQRSLF